MAAILKEQNHIKKSKILLDHTPKQIANYLNSILPLFGDNWWKKFVLSKLTDQQP